MPKAVSSKPFHALASALKEGGFEAHGRRLEDVLSGTWTTSSELIGELGQVVVAIRRECKPLTAAQTALLKECLREVRKAWPGFGLVRWRRLVPWTFGIAAFAAWAAWYGHRNACGPFPDWQSSPYVLPYPVGSTYYVNQSNCTNSGHKGPYKYSYDFVMPIGTTVTAARDGVVADLRTKFRDGQHGMSEANWVKVRHADGTIAAYTHLTENGALVRIGDSVIAGQPIGRSGNTGNTGGLPHLHFHLAACAEPVDCGTLPVTFRNAGPNPDGLEGKRNYLALPYGRNLQ